MNKIARFGFLSTIIIMTCLIWGCREIEVTTQISSDGTCLRSMTTKVDSSELDKNIFHLPYDDSWNHITEIDNADKKITIKVAKSFVNVEVLNAEIFSNTNLDDHIQTRVFFDTKLQGFYKIYHFKEIYRALQPLDEFKVPLSDYLTDKEIDVFVVHPDTSIFKEKIENWEKANLFEEFYEQLLFYHQKNNSAFGPLVEERKESLFKVFETIDDNEEKGMEQFSHDIAKILNTNNLSGIQTVVHGFDLYMEQTTEKLFERAAGTFIHSVQMPGIIQQTNATSITGNRAEWKFEGSAFQYCDYEMNVESRKVYWPALLFVVIVIVGFGLFLLYAFFRKKTMNAN